MRPVQIVSQRSGGIMVQGLLGGENVITAGVVNAFAGERVDLPGRITDDQQVIAGAARNAAQAQTGAAHRRQLGPRP